MNTITQQLADALRNLLRCSTMKTEWGGTALNCGQKRLADAIEALAAYDAQQAKAPKFQLGDRVTKTKGSKWTGRVVGTYSTKLTPEGYAVESETEKGSVQIYPAAALEHAPSGAAAPAASGGEDKGDPVCREDDGCPTEGAVLKRFWRAVNTDDTKQLMAFYGVADVPALIEQQVQHVQSLQIKLKAHEPKRDQFPKSPREG